MKAMKIWYSNYRQRMTVDVKRGIDKTSFYFYPTPSSIRRVCRLLQGLPAFEDVCEWNAEYIDGVTEPDYLSALIVGCSGYRYTEFEMRADYCPHCGRKVKVAE